MSTRTTKRTLTLEQRKQIALAKLFPIFERLGLHVTRNHFYEPIPELRSLSAEFLQAQSDMPGVDMREGEQLALLQDIAELRDEYEHFPERQAPREPAGSYFQRNEQFERMDAEVLYAMIRLRRPRRIIEIGCGFSTLVALAAIARNHADDATYACDLTCVDPYPPGFLRGLEGVDRIVAQRVQDLPLDFFAKLERDDFLFVDSSHVVKAGSDVQFEFLELLPRVEPGVVVHVHDVFFPTDYPPVFVLEWHRFWNEQYLLQAFLAFNSEFAVRLANGWLAHRHPKLIRTMFPSFSRGGMWPSSFWMERL